MVDEPVLDKKTDQKKDTNQASTELLIRSLIAQSPYAILCSQIKDNLTALFSP